MNSADVTRQTQDWNAASTYLDLGGENCCVSVLVRSVAGRKSETV